MPTETERLSGAEKTNRRYRPNANAMPWIAMVRSSSLMDSGFIQSSGEGFWTVSWKGRWTRLLWWGGEKEQFRNMQELMYYCNKLHEGWFRSSEAYASTLIRALLFRILPLKGPGKRASPDTCPDIGT